MAAILSIISFIGFFVLIYDHWPSNPAPTSDSDSSGTLAPAEAQERAATPKLPPINQSSVIPSSQTPLLSPQETARRRLTEMGQGWNVKEFEHAVLNNDQASVELYLQGGFSVDQESDRNRFIIVLPFYDKSPGRFTMLGLFRKYGLKFDDESLHLQSVPWLQEYRNIAPYVSHGAIHVRNESIADELIFFTLQLSPNEAKQELSLLRSYGLVCNSYIQTLSDCVEFLRGPFFIKNPSLSVLRNSYLEQVKQQCAYR